MKTNDQLAAVLDEIAEMERREGFEGPKITGYISSVAAMQDLMIRGGGNFMPKVVEDAIVGEIGRACDARRWCLYLEGPWPAVPHLGEYKSYIILADIPKYTGVIWSASRPLAAAMAYRDAMAELK